jgi:hypothetical protein
MVPTARHYQTFSMLSEFPHVLVGFEANENNSRKQNGEDVANRRADDPEEVPVHRDHEFDFTDDVLLGDTPFVNCSVSIAACHEPVRSFGHDSVGNEPDIVGACDYVGGVVLGVRLSARVVADEDRPVLVTPRVDAGLGVGDDGKRVAQLAPGVQAEDGRQRVGEREVDAGEYDDVLAEAAERLAKLPQR